MEREIDSESPNKHTHTRTSAHNSEASTKPYQTILNEISRKFHKTGLNHFYEICWKFHKNGPDQFYVITGASVWDQLRGSALGSVLECFLWVLIVPHPASIAGRVVQSVRLNKLWALSLSLQPCKFNLYRDTLPLAKKRNHAGT